MYCTNCGEEVAEKAIACPKCGIPPKEEKKFCFNCGKAINAKQAMCVKCGVSLINEVSTKNVGDSEKSRMTYILLGIFFGYLGVHNFYAGYTGKGAIQLGIFIISIPLLLVFIGLLTIMIPGIWALVDICITKVDSNGNKLLS